MSTHCPRYPECGCSESFGTKCHLPDLRAKNARDFEGTELINGLLLEAEKRIEEQKHQPSVKIKKQRNKMKHLTPKKKKRK